MTNDKVIWNIQKLKHHLMDENYDVEALFTLDVAIEALKDEQSYQQTIYKLTETIKEKGKREQWIPCAEQMPEGEVLACDTHGQFLIGFISKNEKSDTGYKCESDEELLYDAIAWRPLLEPYKEPEK